jgi:hypothetical protein
MEVVDFMEVIFMFALLDYIALKESEEMGPRDYAGPVTVMKRLSR